MTDRFTAAVGDGEAATMPGGGGSHRLARETMFVFDVDGAAIAVGDGAESVADPPIRNLADLESRFRQPDGMPLALDRPGRRVGVPVDAANGHVLLVSAAVSPVGAAAGSPHLAVRMLPLTSHDDTDVIQRALGSVLAHELRTPLTTIYGGAQLLAADEVSPATKTEAARGILREADRLNHTIEDLLVLVRRDDDVTAEREPVLLQVVVASLVARRMRGLDAPVVEIRLPADLPPVVGTDAIVGHLVRNVVDHAVGNSPADGTVTIEALVRGDAVELTVSDEGPARNAVERATAFDLFATTRRAGADPSGANLSMLASRHVAERIGARIEAPEATGGRTVIWFAIAGDDGDGLM